MQNISHATLRLRCAFHFGESYAYICGIVVEVRTERLSQQIILPTAQCPDDTERQVHYIEINRTGRFSECTQPQP